MLALPNKNAVLYRMDYKNIFPITRLEYLANYIFSVTSVYIEVISDIKCQLLILHWGEFFINSDMIQIADIYVSILVPLVILSDLHFYIHKIQHSKLAHHM